MSAIEHAKRQAALAAEAKARGIPEWTLEASRAVGTDLLRDIVGDNRRGDIHRPSSPVSAKPDVKEGPSGSGGWTTPPQVNEWSPPGGRYINRMLEAQDERDREENAK